jgi:hypothetical protein
MKTFSHLPYLNSLNKVIIIFLLLFTSCHKELPKIDTIYNVLGSYPEQQLKILAIIPIDGCSYCLNKFIKLNSVLDQNAQINFIYSGNSKKKIDFLLNRQKVENAIVDSKNKFAIAGITHSNPKVYFINGEDIVEEVNVNPSNYLKVQSRIVKELDVKDVKIFQSLEKI